MRAILIDPIAETITRVEHNNDYRQIYELLSDLPRGIQVDDFNTVMIDRANVIFVDGEGLLKDPYYFFEWRGYGQPLAGRGLILGMSSAGDSRSTTWTPERAKPFVTYRHLKVEGFVTSEGREDHPLLGPDTPFIKNTVVLGPGKKLQ